MSMPHIHGDGFLVPPEVTAACGPGGELVEWLEKLSMVKAENYQWLFPNIMLK